MADHERARRRRLGREPLEAAQPTHPVACQPSDLLPDVGLEGGDRVVVPGARCA